MDNSGKVRQNSKTDLTITKYFHKRSEWECSRLFHFQPAVEAATAFYFDEATKICQYGNFDGISPAPPSNKAVGAFAFKTTLESLPTSMFSLIG